MAEVGEIPTCSKIQRPSRSKRSSEMSDFAYGKLIDDELHSSHNRKVRPPDRTFYPAQSVLDHKVNSAGVLMFLVSWLDMSEPTWQKDITIKLRDVYLEEIFRPIGRIADGDCFCSELTSEHLSAVPFLANSHLCSIVFQIQKRLALIFSATSKLGEGGMERCYEIKVHGMNPEVGGHDANLSLTFRFFSISSARDLRMRCTSPRQRALARILHVFCLARGALLLSNKLMHSFLL